MKITRNNKSAILTRCGGKYKFVYNTKTYGADTLAEIERLFIEVIENDPYPVYKRDSVYGLTVLFSAENCGTLVDGTYECVEGAYLTDRFWAESMFSKDRVEWFKSGDKVRVSETFDDYVEGRVFTIDNVEAGWFNDHWHKFKKIESMTLEEQIQKLRSIVRCEPNSFESGDLVRYNMNTCGSNPHYIHKNHLGIVTKVLADNKSQINFINPDNGHIRTVFGMENSLLVSA